MDQIHPDILDCARAVLYIAAVIDRVLDEAGERRLERHVQRCRPCKRLLFVMLVERDVLPPDWT